MEPVDGNALAGPLYDYFGAEMTTARGFCAHCGAPATIAELRVYMRAPGAVVRCCNCGDVVIVLVSVRGETQVDYRAFRFAMMPAGAR